MAFKMQDWRVYGLLGECEIMSGYDSMASGCAKFDNADLRGDHSFLISHERCLLSTISSLRPESQNEDETKLCLTLLESNT